MPWVKEIRIVLDSLKGKWFWDDIDRMIWDVEWWLNSPDSESQEGTQTQVIDKIFSIIDELLDDEWKQILVDRILNPLVDEVAESIWWDTL